MKYTVEVNSEGIFWYKEGTNILHREDGPAIEIIDGRKKWWKEWYINGRLHRVDGPAIECHDGHKEWWIDGKHHREDGPAVEWASGHKSWFYQDKQVECNSQEEFETWIKEYHFKIKCFELANGDKYWYDYLISNSH